MAAIQRELNEAVGDAPSPPAPVAADASSAALLARAQAIETSIEASHRKLRAESLARLTGMTREEARRKIDAEAAPARRPANETDPAQAIAHLEERARAIQADRRAALERAREGVPLALAAERSSGLHAGGVPSSRLDQLVALARPGEPQGRVGTPGVEGGTSVDPRAASRADGSTLATAVRAVTLRATDNGPSITTPGGSLDLTKGPNEAAARTPQAHPDSSGPVALRNPGGRVFGPDGIFATRVYLDSWYVIGPFAGHRGRSMETHYPPESDVDLDGVYPGLDGRVLAWRYASRGFYPFVPPDRAENAVYFAYTELLVDDDRDVWLDIGSDDDSMLWLDDRLIWTSEPGDKPWYHGLFYLPDERSASLALVEGRRRVHLARGVHRLLVKLYNDFNPTFFSVVVAS